MLARETALVVGRGQGRWFKVKKIQDTGSQCGGKGSNQGPKPGLPTGRLRSKEVSISRLPRERFKDLVFVLRMIRLKRREPCPQKNGRGQVNPVKKSKVK